MTGITLTKPTDDRTPVVRITVVPGETFTENHSEERTVRDYLSAHGIVPENGEGVTLNGRTVGLDDPVEPDSVLVVASKVTNG